MTPEPGSAEYWATQAEMWHEKYRDLIAVEDECRRYRHALERLLGGGWTKERVMIIVRNALDGK